MAKFKERLKMIFKSKLVRALSVIILCIIGMITLGRCSKVEAAGLTLPDGTVSKVDLSTSQVFKKPNDWTNSRLVISGGLGYNVVIYNASSVQTYYGCSLASNVITCNGYIQVTTSNGSNSNNNLYKWTFTIGYDSATRQQVGSSTSDVYVLDTYTSTDLENARQEGANSIDTSQIYNQGYQDGQESGYNTGFSEGANSVDITSDNEQAIEDYISDNNYHSDEEYQKYGESQYNKGYDDGESAGFTNGANANIEEAYNNGYSYGYNQGYTSGMSDADNRVNTSSQSYIIGFASGVGSVDITSDNGEAIVNYITNNNYHTDNDYLNYGKAQYTNGYNEGQYTMINGVINNANEKYKTNIGNVCNEDKSKCNTFIESTNKSIYDKGYNDRDITSDNYQAIQGYLSENTLYTQKEYDDFGYNKYLEGAETAEGYEIGYNEGYKEGQTEAEVSILEFFPGIIGAIIGFFITLMQISIFGVKLFDIVGILFGIGLILLILKAMNGGGD